MSFIREAGGQTGAPGEVRVYCACVGFFSHLHGARSRQSGGFAALGRF